ncbi:MAG: SDR family oxidoreductase [Chloroflexi bacterium]|nr:SDR family oxidoreductase [Chloroflexota bacterium]
MDLGLKGKTAIVTGGASNIGRAITLTLAGEGVNVAIFDLDAKQGEKTAEQARSTGSAKVKVYQTNVTDLASVEASTRQAIQDFGQVHILVNVAGGTDEQLFLERSLDALRKDVNLNLWGVINTCRAVLPHMIEKQFGRVVSIASDAGKMGEFKESVYGAAKAGVIAFSKSLSREYGRFNITFNSVCPGLTAPASKEEIGEMSAWRQNLDVFTPEVRERAAKNYPLRRLGTAQDPANMVTFLCSERASFITGQAISVSGGYTMQ